MSAASIHTLAGVRIEPITTQQATDRFIERLLLRGYASNTIKSYSATLADLTDWLDARDVTLMALISERLVDDWLDHLGRAGNSVRSQAQKLSTLRSLVNYAMRKGWIRHDPTQDVRLKFRADQVIAPELARLLGMIERIGQHEAIDLRDRAMLRLGLDAALRVSEVAALDIPGECGPAAHGVNLYRLQVSVPEKGGGRAVCGINAATADAVRAWLAVRHTLARDDAKGLFVSRLGRRFSRGQLHNIIRRRGKQAGLPDLSWHMLRHRRIGDIVESCGLEVGQKVARHKDKSTTANVYGAHAGEVIRNLVRTRCDLDRMGVQA